MSDMTPQQAADHLFHSGLHDGETEEDYNERLKAQELVIQMRKDFETLQKVQQMSTASPLLQAMFNKANI